MSVVFLNGFLGYAIMILLAAGVMFLPLCKKDEYDKRK
jgi:hypothetical protein